MDAMGRIRSRDRVYSGTTKHTTFGNPDQIWYTTTTVKYTDTVVDEVHTPPYGSAEGPFQLFHWKRKPARVSGNVRGYHRLGWETWRRDYYNLPCFEYGESGDWIFPLEAWKLRALGVIQDSGPVSSVPLTIAELKDIPLTLGTITKGASKGANLDSYTLTTNYGILPLVNDIKKMLNVQKEIAERVGRHRRKEKTRRWSGRLPSDATFIPSSLLTIRSENIADGVSAYVDWKPRHKAWYAAELEPTGDLPEALEQICDNPFNIGSPTISDLYNLVPWSFLLDYFTTFGEFVEYQGNLAPYLVKSLCIMCTTNVESTCTPIPVHTWNRDIEGVPGTGEFVGKHRWVYFNPAPSPTFHPLLSGGQLANLASLASVRLR